MKPSEVQSICISSILSGLIVQRKLPFDGGVPMMTKTQFHTKLIEEAEDLYSQIKLRALSRCLPKEQTKEVDSEI